MGWVKRKAKPKQASTKLLNTSTGTPQYILFQALKLFAPNITVIWEQAGLIPGRRFVVDLFVPPRLIIEVDGFGFHRSKASFQKDRLRQNIFAEHGYVVLRYYTGQIHSSEQRLKVLEQIVRVAETLPEKGLTRDM